MENMAFKSTENSSHSEMIKFVFLDCFYVDVLKILEPPLRSVLDAISFRLLWKRFVIMSESASAFFPKQSRSLAF